MIAYLVLGIALLIALILLGRWFASADTKEVVRVLKWTSFALAVALILFLALTGRLAWAFAALPALLAWFQRARALFRVGKAFRRMAQSASGAPSGQASTVETRFLRMTLDHDSGAMAGEVLEGTYAGRSLDDMTVTQVVDLLRTCWRQDNQSAQVLEAYLERTHPDWRDLAGEEPSGGARAGNGGFSDDMDQAEALRILGLEGDPSEADIKEAHRRLIGGLHPDHGGSSYLAAKINQAKDVLLS